MCVTAHCPLVFVFAFSVWELTYSEPISRLGVCCITTFSCPAGNFDAMRWCNLLQITTGNNDKGLKLYDPGYLNTAPVRSSICYIDGHEGILRYRGYPIEELAEMYGNLPTQSQLAEWEFAVSQHSAVPQGILDIIHAMPHDAHPMGVLVSAISALSVFHPDANPVLRGGIGMTNEYGFLDTTL
ncbi:putative citrate synthase [Helianthus annuus]|nr:putative citrate synthase [Helianthus annuus]